MRPSWAEGLANNSTQVTTVISCAFICMGELKWPNAGLQYLVANAVSLLPPAPDQGLGKHIVFLTPPTLRDFFRVCRDAL
jgi:hypothetical protein